MFSSFSSQAILLPPYEFAFLCLPCSRTGVGWGCFSRLGQGQGRSGLTLLGRGIISSVAVEDRGEVGWVSTITAEDGTEGVIMAAAEGEGEWMASVLVAREVG